MRKLYFSDFDDERCYELPDIIEQMDEQDIKEATIIEAKRATGESYFFCKFFQDIGEVRESCGKLCDEYKPNNGKNGRCKHYGYCYEPTGKEIIIKR